MRVPHRTAQVISLLIVLAWTHGLEARKLKKNMCPIGFKLAHNFRGDYYCYKRKEQEPHSAALDDCEGNLYSSSLYTSLNISKLESVMLWAEYKAFYPGGPFVSWSRNENEWTMMNKVDGYLPNDLNHNDNMHMNELCLVLNKTEGYIAVDCHEKFYRYCIVKPYLDRDDMTKKGCEDLKGAWRFTYSKDICLLGVTGVGGGTVRATWNQSQALCSRHGGILLSRGWQYANMPLFHISDVSASPTYPLGIVWDSDRRVLRYVSEDSVVEKPFDMSASLNDTDDTMFIAIKDESWTAVNSSYIFFDVICEHSVRPRDVILTLSISPDNKIILDANDVVDKDDLHCTTDSESYQPRRVKIHHDDDEDNYVLSPATDGYYWCEHTDRYNFQTVQSNKILFYRGRDSLINLYAVKINLLIDNYTFANADDKKTDWIDQLEEYVFYRTRYIQTFDDFNDTSDEAENILRNFKSKRGELSWRKGEAIYDSVIKRLYMNRKTVLLHVELNPEMIPVIRGTWGNVEVKFMKPAFYCKGFDSIPRLSVGEKTVTPGCRTFSCIGDFNEGVQWVEETTPDCTASTFVNTSVNIRNDVTFRTPTVGTLPPPSSSTKNENLDIGEDDLDQTEVFSTDVTKHDESIEEFITSTPESYESVTDDNLSTITEATTKRYPWLTFPTTENTTKTTTESVTTVETTTNKYTTTTEPVQTTSQPLAPEEQLEMVIQDLEDLINNDYKPLTIDRVHDTFDQVNNILDLDDNLSIPGNLLTLLDQLGTRVDLNGSLTEKTVRGNIALLMADTAPDNPVRGVRMNIVDPAVDAFEDDTFEFIDTEVNSTQIASNHSEAVVYLPESVTSTLRRISFLVYRNERAFRSDQDVTVNSRVVSVNVENITKFDAGEVIDIYLAPTNQDPDRNTSRACAYWHFVTNETGYWSQEGCVFIKSTDPAILDICRCDHLTHFAEILVPRTSFSQKNEDALEVMSIVGCCLSIFGIAFIILTALMFRTWRREFSNKIWLQLCIALFLLALSFIIIVLAKFDGYNVGCMLVGISLHYSVLASFCWMLVAAVISYRRLVLVFTREISHKLLRAAAFSWGAPFAVVGVLLSIDPHAYAGQYEEKSPSGTFCYPSGLGLWLAVYAPIAVTLLVNWILFILIVRSVFASRRIQRHGDANEALRCACVSALLVFLFGLPWLFGLFAYNVVSAYFFTCFATFQGFILFLFIVLGNKKTRDLWLDKLKIKLIRKVPVTTSTYMNRSVGGGWKAPESSSTSLEAKNLKPKSLSIDDSRFS